MQFYTGFVHQTYKHLYAMYSYSSRSEPYVDLKPLNAAFKRQICIDNKFVY